MEKIALAVTDLSKVFDAPFSFKTFKWGKSVVAVNNVSFRVHEGEIVGLLGPNGAGKTTTIQMLLGTMTKTNGSIEYFGKDLYQYRSEVLEQVSYASAYTQLPRQLTVYENLMVYARMYNVVDPQKRIHKLLREFKMETYANKRMGSLSAGQTTRVILAKAFINYPKLILLDEPTASLDPESAETVRKFLVRQQKKYNVAMLFTSHNMAEVSQVCDRVIFINHGKITAEDTPEGLARTLTDCTVSFVFSKLVPAAKTVLGNFGKVSVDDRQVAVSLPEDKISSLLVALAAQHISYDQIFIDKPTLEDYFLAKSKEMSP